MDKSLNIISSNPRYKIILPNTEISYDISEDSEEVKVFLEKFNNFFVELENKLSTFTNLNINNYIFEISDPISADEINIFSWYFAKLGYTGIEQTIKDFDGNENKVFNQSLLIMDYRNYDSHYKKIKYKTYWTLKLYWDIKEKIKEEQNNSNEQNSYIGDNQNNNGQNNNQNSYIGNNTQNNNQNSYIGNNTQNNNQNSYIGNV